MARLFLYKVYGDIISPMNTINEFFASIYRWMAIGVAFTAVAAYVTYTSGLLAYLAVNPVVFYVLVGAHLLLYLGIQFIQNKISVPVAFVLFFVYAGMTGVLISSLLAFFVFTNLNLLIGIFAATIALFVGLAILGYRTKIDMSGWGIFLGASTFGIVLLAILNATLIQASLFSLFIAAAVLVVFAGLTVYDSQYYKNVFPMLQTDEEKRRFSIIGALHMYVNFIAMFQSILRIVGFFNQN